MLEGLGECNLGLDLAFEEALTKPDDLGLGLAFRGPAGDVGLGGLVVRHAHVHDPIERCVGLPTTSPVEPVARDGAVDASLGSPRAYSG